MICPKTQKPETVQVITQEIADACIARHKKCPQYINSDMIIKCIIFSLEKGNITLTKEQKEILESI